MKKLEVENNNVVQFQITRNKRKRTYLGAQPRKNHNITYYIEFLRNVWYPFYTTSCPQKYIGGILDDEGKQKYPDNWLRVAFTSMFCTKQKDGYTIADDFKGISFTNDNQLNILAKLLMEHRKNLILQSELKREREKFIKLSK